MLESQLNLSDETPKVKQDEKIFTKVKIMCDDSNDSTFPEGSSYFDESPNHNIKGSLHRVR
jgi:hypothetical protein